VAADPILLPTTPFGTFKDVVTVEAVKAGLLQRGVEHSAVITAKTREIMVICLSILGVSAFLGYPQEPNKTAALVQYL
jgi:hypothetical protein